MDEKELRTSPKQRLFIILIAVFMVGSIVASYAAIVISGSQSSNATDSKVDEAKIAEYSEVYSEIQAKFTEATKDDFNKFIGYKSGTVTAYNENTANENGVKVEDCKKVVG